MSTSQDIQKPASTMPRFGKEFFMRFGVVWAFLVMLVIGGAIYPRLFAARNIENLLSQSAPLGIVAAGMTFVLIGGGFDLSVGAVFALTAVLFASLADGLGLWGAAGAALIAAMFCGMLNGVIVTKLKVNAFVATLGSGSVIGGVAYLYSGSAPMVPRNFDFMNLGSEDFLGLPISIWLMVVFFIVLGVLLARSVYGRSLYSLGGNEEAARLSGIRVDLVRGMTYVISAFCAGVAGMILASRLGVGQADMGSSLALDAIAVVVIGGTSLLGGEGALWRTAVGLMILAVLTNVMDSLALNTNYQQVAKGTIVIAAVAIDIYFRRSKR